MYLKVMSCSKLPMGCLVGCIGCYGRRIAARKRLFSYIWLPDLKSKWILIYWFYLIKIHSHTHIPTKNHYKTFAVIPDFKAKLSRLQYKSSTKRMNWGIYTVSQTAAIIHRPTLKGQAVAYPPNYRLRRFHPNSMKAKCVSVLFF